MNAVTVLRCELYFWNFVRCVFLSDFQLSSDLWTSEDVFTVRTERFSLIPAQVSDVSYCALSLILWCALKLQNFLFGNIVYQIDNISNSEDFKLFCFPIFFARTDKILQNLQNSQTMSINWNT